MNALAGYAYATEADYFFGWAEENLRHSVDRWAGNPVVFEEWQREFFEEALATDDREAPFWSSVALVVGRKNGKTAMLAALALYRLLEDEGQPEILLAAASDKQAGRLFDAVVSYLRRNPRLDERVHRREYIGEIVNIETGGKIIRLPSSGETLDGFNPSLAICDELHAWNTPTRRRVWGSLNTGGGARELTQVVTITTAGDSSQRESGILGRLLTANERDGEVERPNPGLTVSRNYEARSLVFNYSAPTTDPTDIPAMKLANPASWITEQYLTQQAGKAGGDLSVAEVLQLHGCVWAAGETRLLAIEAWTKLACSRRLVDKEKVVLGFDGSERRDETWLVACTLDGFIQPLRAWFRPVKAPESWRIPREEVHQEVDAAFARFDVVELAADPPGWYSEIAEWRGRHGDETVVEFDTRQPKRMAPAVDLFKTSTLEGSLSQSGDSRLAEHVGNCVIRETPFGDVVRKDHEDSPRKIDGAVASMIAFERASWHASQGSSTMLAAWI